MASNASVYRENFGKFPKKPNNLSRETGSLIGDSPNLCVMTTAAILPAAVYRTFTTRWFTLPARLQTVVCEGLEIRTRTPSISLNFPRCLNLLVRKTPRERVFKWVVNIAERPSRQSLESCCYVLRVNMSTSKLVMRVLWTCT